MTNIPSGSTQKERDYPERFRHYLAARLRESKMEHLATRHRTPVNAQKPSKICMENLDY